MWIDFHVHGKLTKAIEFDINYFLKEIDYAKEIGLDSFVLSEHFNTDNYYAMYDELKENFEYIYDYYLINDFKVFMALEVDVQDGGHVIILSSRENIFKLRKQLDGYTNKGSFIPFKLLLDYAEELNAIKIGAHPYRGEHPLAKKQDLEQLKRLDALDLNAKDVYNKGLDLASSELNSLSNELNIPIITGSDTHYPTQLGSIKTNLGKDCCTIEDIRHCINNNKYKIEVSKTLDIKVFSANTTKKLLKAKLTA